jgi:DNA-binding NarL/FixJ family response regulator
VEWDRVRLHPFYTEAVLSKSSALRDLAALAGSHHERIDGTGYHRGSASATISQSARILAAADVYSALIESRAHRPAHGAEAARKLLRQEATEGRLDASAVDAVLAAAGHRWRDRMSWPRGLSDREVEVLRWVARGYTNKQIARQLSISPRTVQHHVVHVYAKIGVSSRAGAALFAMKHDLLSE